MEGHNIFVDWMAQYGQSIGEFSPDQNTRLQRAKNR